LVKIDREIEILIPSLRDEEFDLLEHNIKEDGCRDPLVVWKEEDILVDGHHRYKICIKNNIPFKTEEKSFETRDDVLRWVIDNQLGKRNLTPLQMSDLRGKKYNLEKKNIGAPENNINASKQKKKISPFGSTSEKIAKETGVTDRTIKNDAKFSENVDKIRKDVGNDFAQKILKGEVKTTRQDIVEVEEIKPKEEEIIKDPTKLYTIGYSEKEIGDFLKILQDNNIEILIDIRNSSKSMYKPAFGKSSLANSLERIGIQYKHFVNLGVPFEIRDPYIKQYIKNDCFKCLYKWNIDHKGQKDFLEVFKLVASGKQICLMCFEKYAIPTEKQNHYCHRWLLAELIKNYRDINVLEPIVKEIVNL